MREEAGLWRVPGLSLLSVLAAILQKTPDRQLDVSGGLDPACPE